MDASLNNNKEYAMNEYWWDTDWNVSVESVTVYLEDDIQYTVTLHTDNFIEVIIRYEYDGDFVEDHIAGNNLVTSVYQIA